VVTNTDSDTIASSSTSTTNSSIDVVELGGGRGTNARGILNHLRRNHRDVYDRIDEYRIVDSSDTLLQLQRDVFSLSSSSVSSSSGGGGESGIDGMEDDEEGVGDKVRMVKMDMLDVAENR